MNETNFKKNMAIVNLSFSVQVTLEYVQMVYTSLNMKGVTDEQFSKACEKLMNMTNYQYFETYGGKLLSVASWFELCGISNDSDIIKIENGNFINRVSEYLGHDFIWEDLHKEFDEALSDFERTLLSKHGGIKTLWSAVNRESYGKDKSKILNELKKEFDEGWETKQKVEAIENSGRAEEIKKLTGAIGKKI